MHASALGSIKLTWKAPATLETGRSRILTGPDTVHICHASYRQLVFPRRACAPERTRHAALWPPRSCPPAAAPALRRRSPPVERLPRQNRPAWPDRSLCAQWHDRGGARSACAALSEQAAGSRCHLLRPGLHRCLPLHVWPGQRGSYADAASAWTEPVLCLKKAPTLQMHGMAACTARWVAGRDRLESSSNRLELRTS